MRIDGITIYPGARYQPCNWHSLKEELGDGFVGPPDFLMSLPGPFQAAFETGILPQLASGVLIVKRRADLARAQRACDLSKLTVR